MISSRSDSRIAQEPLPAALTILVKAIITGVGIGLGLYIVRKKMKLQ